MALTDNIIAYWNKNDITTSTIADSVGTNHGTKYAANEPVEVDGKIGKAQNYDGSNDNILSANNIGISGNAEFSISCWIYPHNITTPQTVVAFGTGATALYLAGLFIGIGAGGAGTFGNGNGNVSLDCGGGNGARTGTGVITINAWNHIVITKTAGALDTTTKIYVNGSLVSLSTSSAGTPNITNTIVSFGAAYGGAEYLYKFDGIIDETGIWSRALTSTEIVSLYNTGAGLQYPFASNLANLKSLNTNLKANIKSYNTNLIENVKSINTNV